MKLNLLTIAFILLFPIIVNGEMSKSVIDNAIITASKAARQLNYDIGNTGIMIMENGLPEIMYFDNKGMMVGSGNKYKLIKLLENKAYASIYYKRNGHRHGDLCVIVDIEKGDKIIGIYEINKDILTIPLDSNNIKENTNN